MAVWATSFYIRNCQATAPSIRLMFYFYAHVIWLTRALAQSHTRSKLIKTKNNGSVCGAAWLRDIVLEREKSVKCWMMFTSSAKRHFTHQKTRYMLIYKGEDVPTTFFNLQYVPSFCTKISTTIKFIATCARVCVLCVCNRENFPPFLPRPRVLHLLVARGLEHIQRISSRMNRFHIEMISQINFLARSSSHHQHRYPPTNRTTDKRSPCAPKFFFFFFFQCAIILWCDVL